MPSFQYQSISTNGETRKGVLSAADRGEALRLLLGRGETATRLDEVEGLSEGVRTSPTRRRSTSTAARPAMRGRTAAGVRKPASALRLSFVGGRPTISRADLASLIRELATAIEAGLPLMASLRTVRRQAKGRAMPVILDHLIERVEAGDPLYIAAKDYGAPFDELVVGMLRAADAAGDMSEILHQLADLLDRSIELRREVLGATLYPSIVACLIVASVIILVTVLVPTLIRPLAGQITLPWPTRVVLGAAELIQSYWAFALGGIALLALGWWTWSNVPANRYLIDRAKLRAPLFGRLLRDVAVARFTRTLGTLSSAGLPLLDALRITRNTLGNAALMRAVDEVQDQVTGGKALADPLERSGLFPALLIQVVNLGERSGRLDQMLMHAAGAFDRRVNNSIKLFTKALPPLLLIVMASIGGFVLSAILLPLLQLQSVIS
jgi:type IV pilus assembly protein PilC